MSFDVFKFLLAVVLIAVLIAKYIIWVTPKGLPYLKKTLLFPLLGATIVVLTSWIMGGVEPLLLNTFHNTSIHEEKWSVSELTWMVFFLIVCIVWVKKSAVFSLYYDYHLNEKEKNYTALVFAVSHGWKIENNDKSKKYIFSTMNKDEDNNIVITEKFSSPYPNFQSDKTANLKAFQQLIDEGDKRQNRCNLSQLFRAIQCNLDKLENVILFASDESEVTAKCVKPLLKSYFPHLNIYIHPKSVGYEDPEEVIKELRIAIHSFKKYLRQKNKSIENQQILLDITGGHKPTSAAFATYAMMNELHYQYVTNKREVRVYGCKLTASKD